VGSASPDSQAVSLSLSHREFCMVLLDLLDGKRMFAIQ
jgi:hypothetical protein